MRIAQAGFVAQKRLARGLKLNQPEAVAIIASQMLEMIRDGESVAKLMTAGQQILGRRQVLPGVASMIHEVQVEGTFPDGTKLLTVHSPISAVDGDLALALKGSFFPVPDLAVFGELSDSEQPPGTFLHAEGGIELNPGRKLIELSVVNSGDRPIQVGSHYHFIETNAALVFDRQASYGMRLNVPAGSSVRFEPGDSKTITLTEIAGAKRVLSGNRLVDGVASNERMDEVMKRVLERGFGHAPSPTPPPAGKPLVMSRAEYGAMFGPTTGDKVVLGDTGLVLEVEKDHTVYGDECKVRTVLASYVSTPDCPPSSPRHLHRPPRLTAGTFWLIVALLLLLLPFPRPHLPQICGSLAAVRFCARAWARARTRTRRTHSIWS